MSLKFDFGDFERAARNLDAFADQIPFALAQALNDGVEAARQELISSTWPKHIQARNTNFIKAALSTKGTRATKKNLRVAIYDRLDRASLLQHAKGGTKRPKGKSIAVPSAQVAGRRRSTGVPKGLRPRAVPKSFIKGDVLYQRTGTYQKVGKRIGPRQPGGTAAKRGFDGRRLKLMYTLKPSVPIKADVPFEDDFQRVMRREVMRSFGPRIRAAMATSFKTRRR